MESPKWRINIKNVIEGLVISILTSISNEVIAAWGSFQHWNDINFQRLGIVAMVSLITFLSSRFLKDENGNYIIPKN